MVSKLILVRWSRSMELASSLSSHAPLHPDDLGERSNPLQQRGGVSVACLCFSSSSAWELMVLLHLCAMWDLRCLQHCLDSSTTPLLSTLPHKAPLPPLSLFSTCTWLELPGSISRHEFCILGYCSLSLPLAGLNLDSEDQKHCLTGWPHRRGAYPPHPHAQLATYCLQPHPPLCGLSMEHVYLSDWSAWKL